MREALLALGRDVARRNIRWVLGEMRVIEEHILDPAARWDLLKRALARFGGTS
jgi:hypothetical protein